jgi:2-succinyl-5-enolpyruvyl-6-hydroxy-3-cyclohexene-1-carboxylate synthase
LSRPADDLHSAWAQLVAAALAQCGVAQAVISPGSRSTPLALALAAQLPTTVLHDERVAAFFALGQARATGRVSVVLATSGTARATGCPQRWKRAKPVCRCCCSAPTAPGRCSRHRLRRRWTRCVSLAITPTPASSSVCPTRTRPRCAPCHASPRRPCWLRSYPLAGAVQLNAHFRKPLEPQPAHWAGGLVGRLADGGAGWRAAAVATAGTAAAGCGGRSGGPRARRAARPAGRRARTGPAGRGLSRGRARFAASGYLLLAEASSQLRFGADVPAVCGSFDALLRAPELRRRLRPDLALEIGAPAVSAQWLAWADGNEAPPRLVLPGPRPADPPGGALGMWLGPVAALLEAAAAQLESTPAAAARGRRPTATSLARAPRYRGLGRTRSGHACWPRTLHECQVAPALRAALPAGAWLAIGNSSPVRDLDHDLPPDAAGR